MLLNLLPPFFRSEALKNILFLARVVSALFNELYTILRPLQGEGGNPLPLRPTLRAQAQALASARVNKTNPFSALIIPESWRGGERGNQFMVEVPPEVASRFSRVWGVVASCSDTESSGAPTPFLMNVVLKLPFRFSEDRAQADNGIDIQIPLHTYLFAIEANLPTHIFM